MKYYLEYLTENKQRFMKTLGILLFIIVFLIISMSILLNNRTLESNRSLYGTVISVKMDTLKERSQARYNYGYNNIPVLTISIGGTDFKIRPQYGHYQKELYTKIKKGDEVKIYYQSVPQNLYMPVQIEKNGEVLFPFSFFYNIQNDMLKVIIPILLFLILATVLLLIKRRRVKEIKY